MAPNQVNSPKFVSVRWATLPLALTLLVAMVSRSEASILQGKVFGSADETLAMLGQDQSAGSSSSSAERASSQGSTPQSLKGESDEVPLHAISLHSPLHEGTTSSSSSSSSVSVGGSMPLVAVDFVRIDDDQSIARVAEWQHISLPTPLGADLLRPPQVR